MVSKKIKVINKLGIHMRPAGILAAEMKKFPNCNVTLKTDTKTAKCSAIMQIMSAGIKFDQDVEIIAEGENEQDALDKAVELFQNGFGEN